MVRRFRPSLPTLPALPERWSWARRRRLYIAAALSALLIAPTGVYALFTVLRSIGGNSFSVSSCLHSSVKGVQRGTTINSANGTQTVTISSVDPTKAFLQFSTASNSNRPVGSTIRGRLASATTLEFVRVTDETSPATINITWNVVEYLCGVSVQRGSVTQTTTTTDVSITPVPATNRSFLMWSKTGDPAETDWASGQQTVGELTGTSSLQFRTRATPAGPVAGWYSGWSYRKQITLTAGQISGSLTNFPVLISISDANLAGGAQAGGNDIVFTDGDGTTKLDHEIESYASGTLVAWVRKPTLSAAANTMYMYYGNAGAGSQQNAAGVWNPTYQAVWHLNQTPSDTLNNDLPSSVTATADPATSQGSMASTNPVAGQIGSGLTFNGTSQYLSTSYQQAGPQAFTLEAWFRTTDASASQKGKIIGLDDVQTGTSSTNYGSMMYLGNDGKLRGGVYDGTTKNADASAAIVNNATATWHRGVMTYDTANSTVKLYVDNAAAVTATSTSAQNFLGYWRIGAYRTGTWPAGTDGYFHGQLDELRASVSAATRDPNWISTGYNNQSNPGGFHTFGSQQTVAGGAGTHTIWWQVVSFAAQSEITVQRGTTSLSGGALSTTVTLPAAVTLSHAFALVSFASSGTGADIGARALQATLTDATTLTIQRSVTGDADPIEDIAWQVVDLKDGSRVQSGSTDFPAGTGQPATTTIAPVDTTRATAFASVQYGGGAAMGRTTYVGDDIVGTATATVTLTSGTQVDLVRNNTSGVTDVSWYVVEWGGGSVNAAPVVGTTGSTVAYPENAAATAVDTGLTVSAAGTILSWATVAISTGYQNTQDILAVAPQNGITASWDASGGVLTLSGSASVANYQTALRSVTYVNTSDAPVSATRTVSFVVNDGLTNSNTATRNIAVTAVNDTPVLTTTGVGMFYTQSSTVAVDPGITVTDADSANLTSATVQLTTNYLSSQDVLAFTNQNGITGTWTSGTGVLALSGSASVANYQTALRSITYHDTNATPNTATRTVTFLVNDGSANSSTATRTITVNALGVFTTSQDIGAPTPAGNSSYSGGTYTVTGGGTDIYSTADQFQYAYRSLAGDGRLTARVITFTSPVTHNAAKAGVMMRDGSAGGAADTLTAQTPNTNYGVRFQSRATVGATTTTVNSDQTKVPPTWVRLTRVGNVFTSEYSNDNVTWTSLGSQTVTMSSVLVGLAVSSHNTSTLNTSTFDNVSLSTPPTAVADAYSVNEDSTLTVPVAGVLANDADPEGNALTATLVANVGHGSLTLNGNGSFTYTPTANYSGPDSFTYKANDGVFDSGTVTVTLTVNPANETPGFTKGANQNVARNAAPVSVSGWATAISAGAGEAGQVVGFSASNDNNALFSAQPVVSATGTLTFTVAANATGTATVSVRIYDNGGTANGGLDTSAVQTFTITVT